MAKTYLELYPNSLLNGEGLINDISQNQNCPWQVTNSEDIERAYSLRAANKRVMTLWEMVPAESRAFMLLEYFGDKWKKLWEDYSRQYSPLDGYNLSESGTRTHNITGTDETTFGKGTSTTTDDTGTLTDESTDNARSVTQLYGFNSADPVPSDVGDDEASASNTETRNLKSETTSQDSGTDKTDRTKTDVEEYSYSRKGNTMQSPQDLIRKNIELWAKPYFAEVFSDIDSYIMIGVWA